MPFVPQTGFDIKFGQANVINHSEFVKLTNIGEMMPKKQTTYNDPFADALETNIKSFNIQAKQDNADAFNFVKSEIKIN